MIGSISVVIIENDLAKIEYIKSKLGEMKGNVRLSAITNNIQKGIKAIDKHQPGAVFADINMIDDEGSTLPEKLKYRDFDIIVLQNGEFYKLIIQEKQNAGFILKKIDLSLYFV